MKRTLLIALGLFLAHHLTPASASQSRPIKTKATTRAAAVVPLPANVLDLDTLPAAHRAGVDHAAVLREFEALGKLAKGEFETSDEHAQRVAIAWARSPLSPANGLLGFVVDAQLAGIDIAYDADAQRYAIQETGSVADFCRMPPARVRRTMDVELCVVGILNHKTDSYNGQNAFGVSAQVDRERGSYLSLAVPRKHPFITAYEDHIYRFNDRIDFPLERARGYRTADLRMMLVGEIAGSTLIEGEGTALRPTLDSTSDVNIDNKGLPFKLLALVYFFRNDGRILAIRDFRGQP